MAGRAISGLALTGAVVAATLLGAPQGAVAGDMGYSPAHYSPAHEADQAWPRNLVRALQARLGELGLDPGPADGVYGPRTAAAIKEFQASRGLPPDGRIGDDLLRQAGISQ
jgi:murein L,D-transpeptidase YcbB/YkuD